MVIDINVQLRKDLKILFGLVSGKFVALLRAKNQTRFKEAPQMFRTECVDAAKEIMSILISQGLIINQKKVPPISSINTAVLNLYLENAEENLKKEDLGEFGSFIDLFLRALQISKI